MRLSERLIDTLTEKAFEKSKSHPDSDFTIRGLWRTDLLFRPNQHERTFAYTYVLAQTVGQGCSYCATDVSLDESLMGKDAREVRPKNLSMRVALLDAVYSVFPKNPAVSFKLEGNSIAKTEARTRIVVDEVLRLTAACSGRRPRVVNVGVVGNFLTELSKYDLEVMATDLDPKLVEKTLVGVTVEHGSHSPDVVAKCDVALVTGMTLTTDTLDEILMAAKSSGTKVVLFAETGANFGQEYCALGIDTVVSEPFPFYIFQGQNTIDVFRCT